MGLKALYRESLFDSSFLGLILNPSFIARAALSREVSKLTKKYSSELVSNKNILDVGCGSKPYRKFFNGNRSYVGLDTSNSGHDHKDEDIDRYYDGKIFPFNDRTFDVVVSFQVLEHVQDEALFYSELSRTTKKGGFVLLTIPFCWQEHEQPYDFRRFSSFGIRNSLEKHGFEIMEVVKTTSHLQTILQLLNSYLASSFKTPFTVLNIAFNVFFNIFLNTFAVLVPAIDRNRDLYCDLVVLARSKE